MHELPRLKRRFHEVYPDAGEPVICRAPGRVNLIGEHTDYNGLPVLPMTIDADIRIAVTRRDDGIVHLHNVDKAFPDREFKNEPGIPPSKQGAWENYCKAAVQGLNHHFGVTRFPGMNILTAGAIPIAAGLSSSSALVVVSALAYLYALDRKLGPDISRLALANILADAEHYVGTQGGGMDQAIILLGQEQRALKIDFFPLRVQEVPLPDHHEVIVCNSLVRAKKTGNALHQYNQGPRTCKLICAIVERQAQIDFGDEVHIERLGDLWYGHLCLTNDEVEALFDRAVPNATTILEEAADLLAMTPEEIRDRWLGDLIEPEGGFPLRARLRHQFTAHRRVEAARDAMLVNDADLLGQLMNESHESCARDYQISCRELDWLVIVAREAGAIGARLTGAGMGGCTVNLVPTAIHEAFCDKVDRGYYREYLAQHPRTHPHSPIFVARATPRAGYLDGPFAIP